MERTAGLLATLRNRDFRALWLGQLISSVGDNFALLAGLVVIKRLTDSSLALGIMAMAITLPQLLFGLIGGVFVDRFDRRWVMITSDVLRGLAVLLLLIVRQPSEIYVFYIVGFLVASLGAFFYPARNAVIPNIVEEDMLLSANALMQITQVAAMVFGPALAGLAIGWVGTYFAFVLDSITYLVSAAAIAMMRIPPLPQPTTATNVRVIRDQLVEGLVFIRRDFTILNIIIITAVGTLGLGAIIILAVIYLEDELGLGAEGLGLLYSVEGLGMVAGGVLISSFGSWARSRQIITVGMVVLGLAIISFALAPSFLVVLIGAAIIGLCIVSARATLSALTQALVPDEKRGRVESAVATVMGMTNTASMALAGVFGDLVGVRAVILSSGMLTLVTGVFDAFSLQEAEKRLTQNGDR